MYVKQSLVNLFVKEEIELKNKKLSKISHLLLTSFILLIGTFVIACSSDDEVSKGDNSKENNVENDEQEPLELFLMYNFDGVEFPDDDNPVQQKIEEITNSKLTIHQLPGTAFEERLPVMLASGDMPDAVPIPARHQKFPYVINAVQSGVFWEIGPYLDQFPNLSKINEMIYDNIKYAGKTYGIPRVRPLARKVFQFRVDWLENLGLEEPQTLEDYYEMLKAFTFEDPNGTGKNDTYGVVMRGGQELDDYAPFFGAPHNWEVTDSGEFMKDVLTEEFFESIKFQKKLYDEGLMNRDFTVIDRPEWSTAVEQGEAGVRIDTSNSTKNLHENARRFNPEAVFSMFSILEGDHGKRIFPQGGHNGFFLFPRSSIETEEHLLRVLKFFDDLAGEEGSTLLAWGLEGVHYEMIDGMPVKIEDSGYAEEVDAPYKGPLGTLDPTINALQGDLHPLSELEIELTSENENYLVTDPSMPLISETYLEKGDQLDIILSDAHVKYIMGEIDEDGWREAVQEWRDRGGDQIAKELAEAYKESN